MVKSLRCKKSTITHTCNACVMLLLFFQLNVHTLWLWLLFGLFLRNLQIDAGARNSGCFQISTGLHRFRTDSVSMARPLVRLLCACESRASAAFRSLSWLSCLLLTLLLYSKQADSPGKITLTTFDDFVTVSDALQCSQAPNTTTCKEGRVPIVVLAKLALVRSKNLNREIFDAMHSADGKRSSERGNVIAKHVTSRFHTERSIV
jgi:hypothetical protein